MSLLLDQLVRDGSILLETYGHQVGGHHLLFKFKDSLCKPVIAREHFFYATAPERINRYIATYYGLISVRYVKQPSGEIQVIATRKEHQPDPLPPGIRYVQDVPKCTTGVTIHRDGVSLTSNKGNEENYMNPWSTMCSKTMDMRLNALGGGLKDISVDYMILENLTSKFHSPSVLDLKVGTRQHGDDAPPTKKAKHTHTCAISTSKSLGVRMAGLQKFDRTKNQYIFFDKYFGKQLSEEEFAQVLYFFLDNGMCFRSDLIPNIIKMLEDLRASVETLSSFRYYSSSLLLIYDGAECPQGLHERGRAGARSVEEKLDKILNRTKSASVKTKNGTSGIEDISVPNKGSDNSATPTSYEDAPLSNTGEKVMPTSTETTPTTVESPPLSSLDAPCHSPFNGLHMSKEELNKVRGQVDLRMIDFAHSTHIGYTNDPVTYEGPDEGYITGLDTLISIFRNMETSDTI